MKRLFLIPALALLGGCGAQEIMMGVATLGGAAVGARTQQQAGAEPMDQDRLQSRVRLATAAFDRTTDAFESGKLPTSTSPDTARAKFCDLVIADLAEIGADDVGGDALALTCRAKHHLLLAKAAFANGDSTSYAENIAKADGFIDDLNAIVTKAKGVPQ